MKSSVKTKLAPLHASAGLDAAANGRTAQGDVDAALERARAQVEALAELAATADDGAVLGAQAHLVVTLVGSL